MNNKFELLAPAGNIEAFMGAIHAGADAVYLAGNKFGARAYADNFSEEELIHCIRYAHLFNRKVYMTVNTLFKDEELDELYDYLTPYYRAGLDAVIVQDMGVFEYIKRNFPDMELHVSTQMTITGKYGAQMLKDMGASRIVPARELSLDEIKEMKAQTGLEMETFIHGAMCYCYSGQCLFSSILGGRSGNRGRCAQPCRLPYTVDAAGKHLPECYPLSLKDMCTIEHIGEFMDAGIDSFKIEGRMKKPEYAAGVTAIYRKYIDQKLKNPSKKIQVSKNDWNTLTHLYIRSERQDGYYYKYNGADMVTLDSPAYSGSDDTLLAEIRSKYIENTLKLPVSIYATFYCGCEVSITCVCGETSVTVTGDIMEPAKNQPITEDTIIKQLKKLGDTSFELEFIEVTTDEQGFYSLKAMNELRRSAIQLLEDQIIAENGFSVERILKPETAFDDLTQRLNSDLQPGWSILVSDEQQLKAVRSSLSNIELNISRLYVESELFLRTPDITLPDTLPVFIALPYIMRKKDHTKVKKLIDLARERKEIAGVLIRNTEEYQLLNEENFAGQIISDAGVYVWNRESLNYWKDKVQVLTCPHELNKREWQNLFSEYTVEKNVYARLPMMVTANCISKTSGNCLKGNRTSVAQIKDRYQKTFPVMVQCNYCTNIILNTVPMSLHSKECRKWYDSVTKRISFTIETAEEVNNILHFFENVENNSASEPPYKEYTAGHEKRGVE